MRLGIENHKKILEKRIANIPLSIETTHTLKDVTKLSSAYMSRIMLSFNAQRFMLGSWIGSQPLLIQLLKQPRLTVDLTIQELRKERPYGLELRSLIYLLSNNLILLNFRDYDSEVENNFSSLNDANVQKNLEELLSNVPHVIYFGGVVRKNIFNSILQQSENSYEVFYAQAMNNLRPSHECFTKACEQKTLHAQAHFRGEVPSLHAVSWHWAFLRTIASKIPPEYVYLINPEGTVGDACTLYAHTAQLGEDAKKDSSLMLEAANAFAELSVLLRMCHLNFTAPITASYGSTYNMTDNEYLLSSQLLRQPLVDEVAADEDYLKFLLNTLIEANADAMPHYSQLSNDISDGALVENAPCDSLNYDQIRMLVDALALHSDKISDAYKEITNLRESFLQDNILLSQNVYKNEFAECLDAFTAYNSKKNIFFRSMLDAGWKHIVLPLAEVVFSEQATHFGISPLESVYYWKALQTSVASIIGTRKPRIWKKASHSVLYRIHKNLHLKLV